MKHIWRKVVYKWIKFDSATEKKRFVDLELLQKCWKISELELQPQFILQKSFKIENADRKSWFQSFSAIKYTWDFKYKEEWSDLYTIEEVKGSKYQAKKDVAYSIRKRLFLHKHWNDIIFFENY